MNILDHRILIPKPHDVVWQHVSDVSKNPTWQTDCTHVAIITTSRRSGVGMRWRYSTPAGHEHVAEITAWYDGLGYEYTFVDGVPYLESKGRIRLQEIPEGTIVQWTFSYEMKGLLGNVRNSLVVRRQLESVMIDSLKKLWRVMNQMAVGELARESKSLMRDAPDYEERAHYKPRHPSAISEGETPAPNPEQLILSEPPVLEEDTRPSLAVRLVDEPPFLSQLPSLEQHGSQVTPQVEIPVTPPVDVPAAHPELREVMIFQRPPEPIVFAPAPSTIDEVTPPPKQETEMSAADQLSLEKTAEAESHSRESIFDQSEHVPTTETGITSVTRPIPPEELANMDTAEISVFDVFGLPRPSQTQETQAVQVQETPAVMPLTITGSIPKLETGRVGLRIRLRRRRVQVRRPS